MSSAPPRRLTFSNNRRRPNPEDGTNMQTPEKTPLLARLAHQIVPATDLA